MVEGGLVGSLRNRLVAYSGWSPGGALVALGIAVLLLGAWIVVLVLHPVARYVVGPPPMLALAVVMEGTASLCDPKHENAILVTRLLAILFVGLAVFILIWVI